LNFGLQYTKCCWILTGGYRAVTVTGVALSGNQIPQGYRDLNTLSLIDTNGRLVLHGAHFSVARFR